MSNLTVTKLLPQQFRAIDPICDAFESDWKDGRRPAIEDRFGFAVEALQAELLSELIRIELEWRFRFGESPTEEEYRQRFPRCADALADWLTEARTSAQQLRGGAEVKTVAPHRSSPETDGGGQARAEDAAPSPRILGDYELLEPFKPGGMGEVYKARHRRLNKLVALKLLPHRFRESANMAVRFHRETEAVGRLDHPNLVEAHDAGEEDGVVYLVMKLIPGDDLSDLVRKRGPLPAAEACGLLRQAALGLHELHKCGLVHRDVKPSNIRRTPDGVVKVIDLGLARWSQKPAGGEGATETEMGMVMGTPDYIAPEQVSEPSKADSRADLYGLGCTLFFLLTGRAPFEDRKRMLAKLNAHKSEQPPDVRAFQPEVPAELAELVNRLLAKRPEDRLQTAAEIAAYLDKLAGEYVPPQKVADSLRESARPSRSECPTLPGPLVLRRRKSRRLRLVVGACSLAVLLGLALFLAGRNRLASTPRDKEGAVAGPIQVLGLNVQHFANVQGGFDHPRGVLGKDSFAARRGDSVTVEARLSRPAYAYLIAFRPDGTDEVCFPEQDDEAPSLTDHPCYPSVSRGVNYGLDEGAGLQAFVVVASSQPLLAYREWRARRGASPWKHFEALAGVVWRDDGISVEPLTFNNPAGQRGKGRDVSGKTPIANLTDWLRQSADVKVAAVGFAVLPKDKR